MIRSARKQAALFYTSEELANSCLTFYDRLDKLPIDWQSLAYELRWAFCENNGRPTDPVVYLKCFMIGHFEGIECETDLAARISDSISIRRFLFGSLSETPPDHSSLSRVRRAMAEKCDFDSVLNASIEVLKSYSLVGCEAVAMDTALVPSRARRCFQEPTCTEEPKPSDQADPMIQESLRADLDGGSELPSGRCEPPSHEQSPATDSDSASGNLIETEETAPEKPKPLKAKMIPSSYDLDAHVATKPNYRACPSYKIGVSADYKARVILAADAYPASIGDAQAMRLSMRDTVINLGETPQYAIADAGMDDAAFHACVEFFGSTPITGLKDQAEAASGFGKERFFYDQERNVYVCPAGFDLPSVSDPYAPAQIYRACLVTCRQCPLKIACYGSRKSAKSIKRTAEESSRERVLASRKDPKHRKLLGRRQAIVEPIFGNFKEHAGLGKIWTKGLPCARMKAKLAAAVWNLKILKRYLESGAPTKPKPTAPTKSGPNCQPSSLGHTMAGIPTFLRALMQIAVSTGGNRPLFLSQSAFAGIPR